MLRVISGKYSGRTIPVCNGFVDKPTMSKVRAAIFNALGSRIDFTSIKVLDLFCGSGIFSFESVSRGAEKAYLIDKNSYYLEHIKTLASKFGINEFEIIRSDILKFPTARECCNIVFLDPPFMSGLVTSTLSSLLSSEWISKDTILVVECSSREDLSEILKFYKILRHKKYGSAACYMLSVL